jgi:hypothetical protein
VEIFWGTERCTHTHTTHTTHAHAHTRAAASTQSKFASGLVRVAEDTMAWGWPGLHTQPGPARNSPVKGRPFRSRRTDASLGHADWADAPTVRLTRAPGQSRVREMTGSGLRGYTATSTLHASEHHTLVPATTLAQGNTTAHAAMSSPLRDRQTATVPIRPRRHRQLHRRCWR